MIRATERFAVRPTPDSAWGPRQESTSTGGLLLALAFAVVIGVAVGFILPASGPPLAWDGTIDIIPAAGP